MKKLSVHEWKEMRRRNPTPPVDWSEIWRLYGPKIEEFIQESQKMFHRFNKYFRTIAEELQPGTDLGDICIIGHPDSSDEERIDAVKRFGKRHRYILPDKWRPLAHRLIEALKVVAGETDKSPEKTLELLALSGLYEYSQCVGYTPFDEILKKKDDLIWNTRLKLSTRLVEDILGPDWWHVSPPDAELRLQTLTTEDQKPDIELVLSKIEKFIPIEPMQKEMFRAFYIEGLTHAQIGERVGKTEDAVKVAIHRVRKRILKYFPPDM